MPCGYAARHGWQGGHLSDRSCRHRREEGSCSPPPPPDLEQVDPPVVAAKTPSGELDLALSQVREAVLLTDLVGRAVRDRGKGVDPPDLIDRLIFMRRREDPDPAGRGRCSVRNYLERPAPSLGGQSQRLRMRSLDGFPRPGAT